MAPVQLSVPEQNQSQLCNRLVAFSSPSLATSRPRFRCCWGCTRAASTGKKHQHVSPTPPAGTVALPPDSLWLAAGVRRFGQGSPPRGRQGNRADAETARFPTRHHGPKQQADSRKPTRFDLGWTSLASHASGPRKNSEGCRGLGSGCARISLTRPVLTLRAWLYLDSFDNSSAFCSALLSRPSCLTVCHIYPHSHFINPGELLLSMTL